MMDDVFSITAAVSQHGKKTETRLLSAFIFKAIF